MLRPARCLLPRRPAAAAALATLLAVTACSTQPSDTAAGGPSPTPPPASGSPSPAAVASPAPAGLPGMPALLDPTDVYAGRRVGQLAPAVRGVPTRIYVPNSESDSVDVIDPATMKVIDHYRVGRLPQHVVPSYDLSTLWVNNNQGNTLTPIDPRTGKPGTPIPVDAPYNLYFTPDGKSAMVMAERLRRIDFRDPKTMALQDSLEVPECKGINHADFSADGTYFLASCEFAGALIKVDTATHTLLGTLALKSGNMPQDVRLAPDGTVFYVADMNANGLHVIDGATFRETSFLPTGEGAHGIYFSRDSRSMYVSNRDEGTVSVVDTKSRKVRTKWTLSPGASPDMGGVSADGNTLWLSGRYDAEVYAIDTRTGKQIARIPVGAGPHGLAVFPQPGRYSLGHTGIFR